MSDHKTLTGVEIKDAEKGMVQAVFSSFDVVDSDGDVTLPGAFEEGAPVRISAYGHASWGAALPVGKGVIRTTEKEAVLDGQFFLSTQVGRDTFETVKQMAELQEWSYGFDIMDSEPGERDGEKVRVLKALKVHEVSPVLLGAGVNTRTLAVKSRKQTVGEVWERLLAAGLERYGEEDTFIYLDEFSIDEGWVVFSLTTPDDRRYVQLAFTRGEDGGVSLGEEEAEVIRTTSYQPKSIAKFTDEAAHALASVEGFVARALSLAGIRAKEGRVLSAANRERLSELLSALGEAQSALDALLAESDPDKHADAFLRELARYERQRAAI